MRTNAKIYLIGFALILSGSLSARLKTTAENQEIKSEIRFTENKGQVSDQQNKARPDVLFSGTTGDMVYHLLKTGISYQLSKMESASKTTTYRIDSRWPGANPNAGITKGEAFSDLNNYYLEVCPNGVLDVKSYKEVTYVGIYKGIDLKWYEKNGVLEYDYNVAAGADHHQIQIEISGQKELKLNEKGELVITTPLGDLIEHAPLVIQNGKVLASGWKIQSENTVGFSIEGIDPSLPYVIDPAIRLWGTYYGGSTAEIIKGSSLDQFNNLYVAGYSSSTNGTTIATSGSHQTTNAGGLYDAFIAKFNTAGARQWATYYGSTGDEYGYSCAIFGSGNVYMSGYTNSTSSATSIATAGSHQASYGGGTYDAFVVKFNGSGVRSWGTFYGGTGDDYGYSCSTDAAGNIVMAGKTGSTGAIASSGAHQTVFGGSLYDGYLVKFDAAGLRLFGTYYGSSVQDAAFSCACDASSNIYLCGETPFTGAGTSIATVGSHQAANGGGSGSKDNFLAKFNSTGVRQWATFYGGAGGESGGRCTTDASGNVYLAGTTTGGAGTTIATAGSHQPVGGGGLTDGYVVKFNTSGVRAWGTHYGSSQEDNVADCATDASGNIYICGITKGTTNISTTGSQQTVFGGTTDAYLAKFNTSGIRQYGTYYGGSGNDLGESTVTDATGKTYLVGMTDLASGIVIATTGSHQAAFGGGPNDAYIAQFNDGCAIPTVTGTPGSRCGTGTVVLGAAASAGTISWYAAATGGAALGTGSSFTTPSISTTTTYYAEANDGGCLSTPRTAVVATVNTIPTITGTTPGVRCGTGTVVLGATASAGTISWYAAASGGSALGTGTSYTTSSLFTTTTFYCSTTSGGCTSTPRTSVVATVNPVPSVTGTGASRCGTGTVDLTASSSLGGTLSWFTASTGGSAIGTGSPFTTPSISTTTTYYVEATSPLGCTSYAPRTAVVATVNTTLPTITGTTPGSRCGTGSVTLAATTSAGTISWYAASTGGSALGTGTSYNTPSISTTTTYYAESSSGGCVSASRTAVVATVNAIPTISSTTPGANCGTGTVLLGATASVGNVDWYSVNTGGTLLSTGTSFTTPTISSTTNYYVEGNNNGCKSTPRTSVQAVIGTTIPTITATSPFSRCGPGAITFSATPSSGAIVNWYAAATGGSIIGTGSSFGTTISVTTTYYAEAYRSGCISVSRTAVTCDVYTIPVAPADNNPPANLNICSGTSTTLTAATAPGGYLTWYTAASGGTLLYTGPSYPTPVLSSNTTYYVQENNMCGVSPTRTAITVVVTATPSAPSNTTLPANLNICTGTSTTLTATASGTLNWYAFPTGGTSLGSGSTFTTPVLSSNATYYVENNSTCGVSSRTSISVTVNPVPMVVTTPGSRCGTGNVSLSASATTGVLSWYDVPTGGIAIGTGTTFTTPSLSSSTTYYVESNNNGCLSSPRSTVMATISSLPNVNTTLSGITISATQAGAIYQWLDCNNAFAVMSGEVNQSYVAMSNGDYAVEVTLGGCTDTSACQNISSVGIAEANPATGFSIYPNPVNTALIVSNETAETAIIELVDVTGKVVFVVVSAEMKVQLNTDDLNAGMYFIKIETASGSFVRKVIKE